VYPAQLRKKGKPLGRGFRRIWTFMLGLVSGDALLLPGRTLPMPVSVARR
jgi:hypothetical protein